MHKSDAEKDWMREWDHVPTEKLIELRDTLFHLTPLLQPSAQDANLRWHKVLCELIKEREKHEGA